MTQSSKYRQFLFWPSLSDGKGQVCAKTCLTSAKLCSCVQGLSIYPPSGFNYCVRIMSQIQSALSLTLNLYGASITKPTASTAHTSCPGVTSSLCVCACVCMCVWDLCLLRSVISYKSACTILQLAHIIIRMCDNCHHFLQMTGINIVFYIPSQMSHALMVRDKIHPYIWLPLRKTLFIQLLL